MRKRKKYNSLQFWRKLAQDNKIFFRQNSGDISQIFNLNFDSGTTLYVRSLVSNITENNTASLRIRQINPNVLGGFNERNNLSLDEKYDYKFPLIQLVADGIQPPPFNPPDHKTLQYRMGASRDGHHSIYGWLENTKKIIT